MAHIHSTVVALTGKSFLVNFATGGNKNFVLLHDYAKYRLYCKVKIRIHCLLLLSADLHFPKHLLVQLAFMIHSR